METVFDLLVLSEYYLIFSKVRAFTKQMIMHDMKLHIINAERYGHIVQTYKCFYVKLARCGNSKTFFNLVQVNSS